MHINEEALLDYLYEEGDSADRLKTARHLQDCTECAVAVLELQEVRGMLGNWTPPAAPLGFRIVQDLEQARRPAAFWRAPLRSAWGQAAAAMLLFTAGAGVSQLDVDYGRGALTVRTRSASTVEIAAAPLAPAKPVDAVPAPVATRTDAAAGMAIAQRDPQANPRLSAASTEELLSRVRTMIEQSEARQQRQLALRLTQVASEFDTARLADVRRMEQNLIQTGAEIDQQRQMMDYFVKTSGQPQGR